jgi:nitrate reductase assembly molybdenum cofactor insertion protein NarJ/Fe-S-cluster-containing hydrogenase component 2
METAPSLRADLYQALAEALAEPPEWLALAGDEWPLTAIARSLAGRSAAMGDAVARLAEVPAESLATRRRRYAALSAGPGRPRFWFYESAQREGRLLGQASSAVACLYRAAGLELAGAELPDHASVELAFLAFLARRQANEPAHSKAWRQLERRFIKEHGGRWLPALGRALAASRDPVYAPIGRLLARWLDENVRPRRRREPRVAGRKRLLRVARTDECTLCGFCSQVCPTGALAIRETGIETMLLLLDRSCTGCAKCVAVCDTGALNLETRGLTSPAEAVAAGWLLLRRSPRAICPACNQATVSCAELDFVARQIGRPAWLAYCLSCRPYLMEKS